jgi:hypothetical protein
MLVDRLRGPPRLFNGRRPENAEAQINKVAEREGFEPSGRREAKSLGKADFVEG